MKNASIDFFNALKLKFLHLTLSGTLDSAFANSVRIQLTPVYNSYNKQMVLYQFCTDSSMLQQSYGSNKLTVSISLFTFST